MSKKMLSSCLFHQISFQDGEHISKEKNGQQGGNRGRSRKNKFRVTNGMGI